MPNAKNAKPPFFFPVERFIFLNPELYPIREGATAQGPQNPKLLNPIP